MNIIELYNLFLKYPNICIDSRKAKNGSLFFALKGENFDGNKFVEEALANCKYAVIDDEDYFVEGRTILVNDVLRTLHILASYHRKRLGIPIIAITGTNGKTTTKELIVSVLSEKYKVAGTVGNLNNQVGVPITILSMNSEHEIGVVEMGASHVGDIDTLCKIVLPDFGIITNVGKAHLGGFKSFEGVKQTKGELYKYLSENNGLAFINVDDEILEDLNPPKETVFYGKSEFTHCQGRLIKSDLFFKMAWASDDVDDYKLDWNCKERFIETNLIGKYNFYNVLAAICVGHNFGVSDSQIKNAIENYKPINNRSQLLKTSNNILFADNYNANPSSMKVSIDGFSDVKLDNKVLIIGDMFELGESAYREHIAISSSINKELFDLIIFVGENFCQCNSESENVVCLKTTDELFSYLKENKLVNKSVLLKGSRGMHLEKVIDLL